MGDISSVSPVKGLNLFFQNSDGLVKKYSAILYLAITFNKTSL